MEELEKALLDVFNQSQMPLEAKKYVLKHLYVVVNLEYQLAIEKAEREKAHDAGGTNEPN